MGTHMQDSTWSADDIRANAQTWSLEGDAKLLDFMKNLSKKIEERGNRTTHSLHKMQLDLDRAQVALGNTTNRLMSLQNSQFVENRVYDDEETLTSSTSNVDKIQSTAEKPSLVDALQYALNSGVKMMDKYYEKVSFVLSDDSEDDEVDEAVQSSKSIIFRPKDPYRDRPLPHLIGSKDWQEKWHIGLIDSDVDDGSDNEPVDEMSESTSSSSPSMSSLHSHVPASMSESENSVWGIDSTAAVTTKSSDHNKIKSDIFSESSEDDKGNKNNKTSGRISHSMNIESQSGLLDQLSNSLQSPNNPTANTIFRQPPQPAARAVAANLFDSEPPELDASPIFPSTQNSARKPINLFLDDDDDDDDFDMFASQKTESAPSNVIAPSVQIQPNARKPINLFEDEDEIDDVLFGSSAITDSKPIASTATKSSILSSMPPKSSLLKNLFDDEPPEDDFDFLTKPGAIVVGRRKEVVTATSDIGKPNETEKVDEKNESESISTASSSKFLTEKAPAKKLSSKINLFDDDEDSFERLIGSKVENASRKEAALSKIPIVVQPEAVGDDDDSFDKLIGWNEQMVDKKKSMSAFDHQTFVQPKPIDSLEKPPSLNKKIFDDESDQNDPFIDPPALNASKSSVLDSNEDLFERIAPPAKKEEKPIFNYASPHLFDDLPPDDDDDFVATPAKIETKQPSEFYNDFSETVTVSSAEASTSQYSYLFNDEPPPDDDLFQTVKPKVRTTKQSDSDFSRKLHIFANPEKVNDEPPKAAVITNKPKKLNIGNFDINVAALLPGAKRTVSRTENDAVSPSDQIDDEIESMTSTSIAKRVDIDNVDDAGRLKNLTRNRAKAQMRRPSTRRGRQQQYEKTLDVADETVPDSNEGIGKVIAPKKENPHRTAVNEIEAVPIEPEPSASPDGINETVQPVAVPTEVKPANEPDEPEISNERLEVQIPGGDQQIPAIKNTDLSFLDDSDGETPEDDDWLSNVIGPTTKSATQSSTLEKIASKTKIESSLFDVGGRTEWKADSPAAQIKSGVYERSYLTLSRENPPPLQESNSLFNDSEEPEANNDIFSPVPSRPVQISALEGSSLFDDKNENYGDEPPPLQQTNSLFNDLEEPEDDDDIFLPAPAYSIQQAAPKNRSLFDDEDKHDEDPPLSEARKSVIAPVPVQPKKSLFGDDLSDDDDLFGAPKSAKKEMKRVASASNKATVLNSKKVSSGKLFSDSDDDDDDSLFGSKAKPPSFGATKIAASNVVQNRITKAKASSVTDQDPLADLLK